MEKRTLCEMETAKATGL